MIITCRDNRYFIRLLLRWVLYFVTASLRRRRESDAISENNGTDGRNYCVIIILCFSPPHPYKTTFYHNYKKYYYNLLFVGFLTLAISPKLGGMAIVRELRRLQVYPLRITALENCYDRAHTKKSCKLRNGNEKKTK